MSGPTAASAVPAGRGRTPGEVRRRFGEVDATGTSPLYERAAVALIESGEALRAIEAVPVGKGHPAIGSTGRQPHKNYRMIRKTAVQRP